MAGNRPAQIKVLLTVPQLLRTSSPYREAMAIAKYLPRDEFDLTVCALRKQGLDLATPVLEGWGVSAIAARFRPTIFTYSGVVATARGQGLIANHGPFHIQHSLDWTSSPIEAFLARKSGRKFIYNQANLNVNGSKVALKLKMLLAHHIISVSAVTARFVAANGAPIRKVTTVPLGLDIEEKAVSERRGGGGILSVGHIIPLKRHEDAIKALSALAPSFPGLRLRIVGPVFDEKYFDYLNNLARTLGVSESTEFLGVRNDVMDLMAEADLLLHCSESEASPWVIREAWSVGLPVVASAIDSHTELIRHGETGLLAPTGDIEALSAASRCLLTSPALVDVIAHNAREELAKKYTARAMVEAIAGVYRSVASRGRRASREGAPETLFASEQR